MSHASTARPVRHFLPLSAHATAANLRISVSPVRSVRPISLHVAEPDGTAWRVLTIVVDGVVRRYGDPPYPACRGNCWIDLEVECPHDHPPTEAEPIELRGVVLCEASDLPVSAGDTERDRQWAADFRKPRGARKSLNGECETTYRGDASPMPPGPARFLLDEIEGPLRAEHLPRALDRLETVLEQILDAMPAFEGGEELVVQLGTEVACVRDAAREACLLAEVPWRSARDRDRWLRWLGMAPASEAESTAPAVAEPENTPRRS